MSHASLFFSAKKLHLLAVLLVMVATVVLMLGFQGSVARADEGGCVTNALCVWTGTSFTEIEGNAACPEGTGVTGLFSEWKSAKNRCGSANVRIGWREGSVVSWKACMNPGGERPEPGRFNVYQHVESC